MNLKTVHSSSIHAIGHDPATNTLVVQFFGPDKKPGKKFSYPNVSADLYTAMSTAKSVGSYFGKHIKGKKQHPHTELKD